MKDLYNVSASPHVRSGVTTRSIMRDVAIALIPASAFGVYQFGFKAFLVLLTSVASACICEFLWKRFVVKKSTPYECSALVTGLLLGMNLPASVPLWIPVVGSAFAILVVKEMFGGLGQNFMNPALGARCFLLICFAGRMTAFGVEKASSHFMNGAAAVDGISSATPLAVIKNLEAGQSITGSVSLFDMFFGFTGGVIGETSTIAIRQDRLDFLKKLADDQQYNVVLNTHNNLCPELEQAQMNYVNAISVNMPIDAVVVLSTLLVARTGSIGFTQPVSRFVSMRNIAKDVIIISRMGDIVPDIESALERNKKFAKEAGVEFVTPTVLPKVDGKEVRTPQNPRYLLLLLDENPPKNA